MDSDSMQNRLATKRKLGFLKTFDKRIEGLKRERQRLERVIEDPDPLGPATWLENVERIVRGFIGAGPVYGINNVSEWAKKTIDEIQAIRERAGPPTEEELLWLSSTTQELNLLHSEAMVEIEEKYGVESIQKTTLPPEDTTVSPHPGMDPTKVTTLPPKQIARAADSISTPPPLGAGSPAITPITEDDIVTSIPDEVGSALTRNTGKTAAAPPAEEQTAWSGVGPARVDTLAPAATTDLPARTLAAHAKMAAGPETRPRPAASAPSSPEPPSPKPRSSKQSPAPAPVKADSAAEEPKKTKEDTFKLTSNDIDELPKGSFVESVPPPAPSTASSGISRAWIGAMVITWIALLVSLYFNWLSYGAGPITMTDGTASEKPAPTPADQQKTAPTTPAVGGPVSPISIQEKPAPKNAPAKTTAAKKIAKEPAKTKDKPPEPKAAAKKTGKRKKPAEKPPEKSSEPTAAGKKSPATVSPSKEAGVLSVLVPPNASGPVSIDVDKRTRGTAPIKIKLKPGLHEVVQNYKGKRTMRIVLIRKGKTKIITAKIPD
jgi:hypothetical protein